MQFRTFGFETILNPRSQCPYTGKEVLIECTDKDIKCYFDKDGGSKRFVLYVNGRSVSALQIMIRNNEVFIANVITVRKHRQKGYAKRIWIEAKKHHHVITHSPNLSPEGLIFSQKCN